MFTSRLQHCFLACALGITVHHGILIRGEWHLYPASIVISHLIGFAAYHLSQNYYGHQSWYLTALPAIAYLAALFSSITIYRLFFHRLRMFPGPRLAAVSKLWHVWMCRNSRGHLVLDALHKKYGPFVRTGPNELTIFHPLAFEYLDGPKSRTTRSEWYDILQPITSVVMSREKSLHSARRKIWERAFSLSYVTEYYRRINSHIQVLTDKIEERLEEPIVLNDLLFRLFFDSMGDFGFGQDFGTLKHGNRVQGLEVMRGLSALLGIISPAIWIARAAFAFFPGVWKIKHFVQLQKFSERCARDKTRISISSAFLQEYERLGVNTASNQFLRGESSTLLIAASDTAAPSAMAIFYFLAQYPEHAARIQEELINVDCTDVKSLALLPHLNGVINEAMRLIPGIPTFGNRFSPPEGFMAGDTFIPGSVTLCAPRYSIHRLENAFERPTEFIPERWYKSPKLIKEKAAFAPFSMGRTMCIGKNIALAQLRLVTAALLSRYNIEFAADTGNGQAVERDMLDQLTAKPGDLTVVWHRRSIIG
ncbi:benzoate 4-monooxygenase cytochrome P450 [Coniella lustricola]|uniref:Benzoate 4-monooxygenase cytochrome P450 n=1 Tax=Coniella lustricola TaxID=2025994 RepID=A0A2T2ZU44_9PEZI|nr:benzoate 4-monooxygenase cytochrome P450 [Coniella lustricola]